MAITARRRVALKVTAIIAAAAAVVTVAVVANGYDAQEVDKLETSVWVTRSAGQYARVDTNLRQIDTVRDAEDPSWVAQSGSAAVVFTDGLQKIWNVDPADPKAMIGSSDAASESGGASVAEGTTTPAGTRDVVASGDWTVYLTDTGKVFVSQVSAVGASARPVQIDPLRETAKEGDTPYDATAVAVADDGTIVMYSAAEQAVRRYNARTSTFADERTVLASPPAEDATLVLTVVGGRWVLGETGGDRVWIDGHEGPVDVGLAAGAVAQRGSSDSGRAYFADETGLVSVDIERGTAERVQAGTGTPAAPTRVDGKLYAAWLDTTAGTLWTEGGDQVTLEVPGGALDQVQQPELVIASNGRRAVLNETTTGLLWSMPDGEPIPLSQWQADEQETQETGTVEVTDVAQEEPPVAESDAFGVRSGGVAVLPVLLNDHDPNKKDVLTVEASSISGGLSDPAFGELTLSNDNQQILVRVRAESGSATFSYAVTDGQQQSPPTTVTLTVAADDADTAPVWCGVEGCLQDWPTVEIAPGGTVSVPVLTGWVDPEGDPMILASAVKDDPNAPLTVVPTADGRVAIRHTDPNAAGATLSVVVTVTDDHGASATKILKVAVTANPALVADPVVAVAGVDQERTVAISPVVSGGSGSYRLVDAVASSGQDQVNVVPNVAAGTVQLSASSAGEYIIGYTVQDAQTEAQQNGILRFSVVGGSGALSMPPLTAFVRSDEDTTLEVLDAVQNTTGHVLALASATSSDAQLSVGIVDGAKLRVSGTTPDGQPGRVGTASITVTDGAGSSVSSTVTVFQTAPAFGVGPIAVPDAISVRAGAQVNIPVTENDIAPRGEQVLVHPDIEPSGAEGELAFVAGTVVRYLAPPTPGVYTLRYSDYLDGDPARLDSAAITVTVLPAGENHTPEPTVLSARVAAGQTVRIPVPASGMDPDGDPTSLVAITQPAPGLGSVVINADGSAIRYTAPAGGVPDGQLQFSYTLRDDQGAEGTGTVRIAVLGGELADVTPVTYTDGVRAVTGTSAPLTVQPLLNDRDPAGGTLQLVSLVPNAPDVEGNTEYARLDALIDDATDLEKGIVSLRAGTVQGVQSYVYTVRSSATSSTAQGLIVVTVAGEPAPDNPVISDTVLTIADRSTLASGVDVITGKTVWASGDISALTLAVWGDAASGYVATGNKISGRAPVEGALVPFSLTGEDSAGKPVAAYGFLRIPALDAMRVQLRGGITAAQVNEDESVRIALGDSIQLGDGDRLEVREGGSFPVQRGNASCAASGAASVTYTAGRNAPWTDSCTVEVRIAGQDTWTQLPIPVVIQPRSPQAILSSISRTVAPGASQSIDLYADLTTWEGGRVGDRSSLDYRVAFTGGDFVVEQNGSALTVTARADARPGARQNATVTVTSFGGLSATLSLIVGAAPTDAPRGATFTAACAVSAGASCTIPVVGIAGEYDPFAGTPGAGLTLAGISVPGCAVAGISASGTTSVTATWPTSAKPSGGTCIVPFTVVDAQGRTGVGTLTIDVQGYPAPPSSITTTAFTGSSVTMLVTLGEAANAIPGVTGAAIYENGVQVPASCVPGAGGTFSCTVPDLVNGQRHTYTARAVNPVGESLDTTPVVTWAYNPPAVLAFTAAPVFVDGQTSTSRGGAELSIETGDDVATLQIAADSGETVEIPRTGPATLYTLTLPVGARQLTVVPVSQFQPPLGTGSSGSQAAAAVQVAGSPYIDANGALSPTSNTSLEISGVQPNGNFSAQPLSVLYAAWAEGQSEPACSADASGAAVMPGGQAGTTFTGLPSYTRFFAKACVSNGFGAAGSAPVSNYTFATSPAAPGGLTYTVDTTPDLVRDRSYVVEANFTDYTVADVPSAGTGFSTRISSNYGTGDRLQLSADQLPGTVTARYCWLLTDACGTPSTIAPKTAPTTVTVAVTSACTAEPKDTDLRFSKAVDFDSYRTVTVTPDAETEVVTYRVVFRGEFASLPAVELTRCFTPPPPEPTVPDSPADPTDP
ncbi:Ig-like domain-containing protein [Microbacterium sp. P01]|uniref:Ig-like domain-containing protein n=1 Tax=Microbacterium sp. P01 TaxID=3366261 RepID=UPI00366EECD2